MFALGAVLVAASGGSAFGHGSAPGLMFRVVHEAPDVSAVPPSLLPVVLDCLLKDPARRPSPRELLVRCAERAGGGAGIDGRDSVTHEATVADEAPAASPPLPPTETVGPVPALPLAIYRVPRRAWLLQVLRHGIAVAGPAVGAMVSAEHALPVAIPVTASVVAVAVGIRLLGLHGAAKDALTLTPLDSTARLPEALRQYAERHRVHVQQR
ncbi:hypothetical protein AB0M38_20975 [Streptomyces sp. NPDC051742]|uniref:hypothetical protein n=1 Tax=unclassified Streptomyces TaxID=2593676 RepID=UPI003437FBAF